MIWVCLLQAPAPAPKPAYQWADLGPEAQPPTIAVTLPPGVSIPPGLSFALPPGVHSSLLRQFAAPLQDDA